MTKSLLRASTKTASAECVRPHFFREIVPLFISATVFGNTGQDLLEKCGNFLFEVSESGQESRPMRFSRAVNLGSDRRLSNVGSILSKTRMKS